LPWWYHLYTLLRRKKIIKKSVWARDSRAKKGGGGKPSLEVTTFWVWWFGGGGKKKIRRVAFETFWCVFDAIRLFLKVLHVNNRLSFLLLLPNYKKDFFIFFYKKGLTINHYNEKEKRMYGKNELTPFFFRYIFFQPWWRNTQTKYHMIFLLNGKVLWIFQIKQIIRVDHF
jgi:hypothetical protein